MLSLISTLLVLTTLFTTLFAAPIPLPLEERQSLSPTRNDLSGSCKAVTVIFARGTSEPGNVGLLAGPPFFNALGSMIGYDKVAVQGVPYPATIAGYLIGGSPEGATSFAGLLGQVVGKCPGTKIVVGGYSQGAQVIHNGLKQVSADVAGKVAAAVLFGDPDNGQGLQGVSGDKVVTFCFKDDLICKGAPVVLAAHLSYSLDAGAAAAFVKGKIGL